MNIENAKLDTTPYPIRMIFHEFGLLEPVSDITPLEAVHLNMLLVCASGRGNFDYSGFIRKHALERHFKAL